MKKDEHFYSVITSMRSEAFCLGGDMATDVMLGAYPEFTEYTDSIREYFNAYEKIMDISLKMYCEEKDKDANVKEELQTGEENCNSPW